MNYGQVTTIVMLCARGRHATAVAADQVLSFTTIRDGNVKGVVAQAKSIVDNCVSTRLKNNNYKYTNDL
jgi:hypothetical protein